MSTTTPLPTLVVVKSDQHSRHNPQSELEMGYFVPFKESPRRVDEIVNSLNGLHARDVLRVEWSEPIDHGLEPLTRIHAPHYVKYLESAYKAWVARGGNPLGVFPDVWAVREFANARRAKEVEAHMDVENLGRPGYYSFDNCGVIVDGTYAAAYSAVQVALTGAEIVARGPRTGTVFALCRPPGHHAHTDMCGGYCFFNNAAVAASHLIEGLNVGNVAILDIDYHHGNGTQEVFYKRSNPLYVSIHGNPDYPFYWGAENEIGEGEGLGHNLNLPLPVGTRDSEYLVALKKAVARIAQQKPEVVIVSLGVDTFEKDVVGNFLLTSPFYETMGREVASLGVKTLVIMEGGYDIEHIGLNVTNFLKGVVEGRSNNVPAL